jgi:hypothetical protein
VLVLDEPANGLDPEGVHRPRGLVRGLADQGRTALVSSHLLAEVAQSTRAALSAGAAALTVVVLAAAVALSAVLGTGLGALLRNQFAAVIVGLLWWQGGIEDLVVGLLRRPGLERWLPDGAALALTAPGDGTLPTWAGGLVFAAYGLALALLGGRLVARRDLS